MRKIAVVLLLLVSPFLLISSAASAEDLTIISTVTPSKGKTTTSTQYVSETKVRVSDGQYDSIVDLESGSILHIEHKKKRYYETTFEEMRAHFAELEEMLDSNPMMARMLGGAAEVRVEELDGTRDVAGYACKQYVIHIGKKFQIEVWATKDLEVPIEYYEARKMLYAMMGPTATRFVKMIDEMQKLGVALASTTDGKMMGISVQAESVATEVRIGSLPADAFEVPAGYKKQKKSPYKS